LIQISKKEETTDLSASEMLIQVINLARRPDRLAWVSAELKRAGLSFEIQVAVDGQLETLNSEFISKGAIGCWKSHVNSMRRLVETNASFGLILEDDAVIGPEVNGLFLAEMMDLMRRNQLDILQIGFIDSQYSISLKSARSGTLEFLIDLLKRRGVKDSSGFRIVTGEFRSGSHAYIVSARLATEISATSSEPPLVPWDDYLGMLAKGQMHRGIRVARLVKNVSPQRSHQIDSMRVDSDVYPSES
jgi:GR25 family glycosyltransferase involved in LPS biosynthesis